MSARAAILVLVTVVLNGGAQLLLRAAALRGATPTEPMSLLRSPLFLVAVTCYGVSVLTWLAVLKRVQLTIAMPCVALVYVLVPLAAKLAFGDAMSLRMALGMLLVVAGVILVAAAPGAAP